MKIIIDIPEETYKTIKKTSMVISGRRDGRRIDYILFNAVNTGTPLEEEFKAIKEDMKDTFYDYKNNRYDVSMEGVLDVLDKRIKENKE